MGNRKVIILVMGTNESTDPFFRQEYEQCCKNTWMKQNGCNYKIIYYQGGTETKLENDILTVACEDDLASTYKKTYFALNYIHNNFDYDFIFRTNTSTYINIFLLDLFLEYVYDPKYYYGSDIYSLSEGFSPYPLSPYRRGNGIIFSKREVETLLKYGINLLYLGYTDDISIDNVMNSYKITEAMGNNVRYEDNHKGIPHSWFNSVDEEFITGHVLSSFKDSKNYWFCPTITVKKYRKRDEEFENYFKCHKLISKMKYPSTSKILESMREYSNNFSMFIGSILGYVSYNDWKTYDKNRLYLLEISTKASDDEQFHLRKEIQGRFESFDMSKL